jgi:transposase InsO family protein
LFCGTENYPFALYPAFNDIEHRRTKVRHPQPHGFVERFHRTVLDEFYRVVLRPEGLCHGSGASGRPRCLAHALLQVDGTAKRDGLLLEIGPALQQAAVFT